MLKKSLLIMSLLLCHVGRVSAWEAITHHQLGVESGADPSGSFQNLPDSWPSHGNFWEWFEITEWFAWSHGVQRTGRTSTVPNVPIYPADNRNPGEDMYRIYKNNVVRGNYVYETALGFLAHIAQDRQVHYDYFRGGSRAAWMEEHGKKEQWADCWIYQIVMNGKFDRKGQPSNLPRIKNLGNSDLISESQKTFISAGLSTDIGRRVTLPKRETPSEIDGRLSATEAAIQDYLAHFDKWHCRSLKKWARNYAWTLDKLEEYYKKALNDTRKLPRNFPRSP